MVLVSVVIVCMDYRMVKREEKWCVCVCVYLLYYSTWACDKTVYATLQAHAAYMSVHCEISTLQFYYSIASLTYALCCLILFFFVLKNICTVLAPNPSPV